MEEKISDCQRCGTCCTSGGPALHSEDLRLIRSGAIPLEQLITIRAGELVHNPLTNKLQPIRRELVKVSGTGKQWSCFYYDPGEKGCSIYDTRPKACRVLKCWETEEIEQLIEQDTLSRFDLIAENDPVLPFVREHEKVFPCPDMERLRNEGIPENTEELEEMINGEIAYRTKVVQHFNLSVGAEMFYFGRPLFHLLVAIGFKVTEVENRFVLDRQTIDKE